MVHGSTIKGTVNMQKYLHMINDVKANSVRVFFNWTNIPLMYIADHWNVVLHLYYTFYGVFMYHTL